MRVRGIPRHAWWSLRRSQRRAATCAHRAGGGVTITLTYYRAGEVVGMESWEAVA